MGTGALLEPVGPVVAFAPSGVCWAGLDAHGPVAALAWRFGGYDIPCAGLRPTVLHGFTHQLTHLRYPGAGHLCGGVPGTPVVTESRHPLTGQVYSFGGSRPANAHARADSWPRVLQFLLKGSIAK